MLKNGVFEAKFFLKFSNFLKILGQLYYWSKSLLKKLILIKTLTSIDIYITCFYNRNNGKL